MTSRAAGSPNPGTGRPQYSSSRYEARFSLATCSRHATNLGHWRQATMRSLSWERGSPTSPTHCRERLTAGKGSLRGKAHCGERLTAGKGSLRGKAHCGERLTAGKGSLRGKAHCGERLTAGKGSRWEKAHRGQVTVTSYHAAATSRSGRTCLRSTSSSPELSLLRDPAPPASRMDQAAKFGSTAGTR